MSKNKYYKKFKCGADRDRTCDPRVANAMLSQLSYSPKKDVNLRTLNSRVGLGRLELPTPALSERCSNQLSYKPDNIEGISKNVILSSTIDRVSSIFSLERR